MLKRRSTSLVPSGVGQLTLYDCQKKIRTKEDNSSDVIDLTTLSSIDGTGTADRITKDDMCSDTCMLAVETGELCGSDELAEDEMESLDEELVGSSINVTNVSGSLDAEAPG